MADSNNMMDSEIGPNVQRLGIGLILLGGLLDIRLHTISGNTGEGPFGLLMYIGAFILVVGFVISVINIEK